MDSVEDFKDLTEMSISFFEKSPFFIASNSSLTISIVLSRFSNSIPPSTNNRDLYLNTEELI